MATIKRIRGRNTKVPMRAQFVRPIPAGPPLRKTVDFGEPISVDGTFIGAANDRWVEAFLEVNEVSFRRLALQPEVRVDPNPRVLLRPTHKVGALPLLNPSTRRVAAGILIEPRIKWTSMGSVLAKIGFSVPVVLGGAALVPGSAREVPAWILAAPVIQRIESLLLHRVRQFQNRSEIRKSPRGAINWGEWARKFVPRGDWTSLPCSFSELDDDQTVLSAIRWTLGRLSSELNAYSTTEPGRHLLNRANSIFFHIGPGPATRPTDNYHFAMKSEWLTQAFEAMGWVTDERGLGGSHSLNGLPWDLSVDQIWESWVSRIAEDVAKSMGLRSSRFGGNRHILHWSGPIQSMSSLIPDVELHGDDRVIWLDAKYKAHMLQLRQRGWDGVSEDIRREHRADLHQALAYASLSNVSHVDTILVYPTIVADDRLVDTIATVTSGHRTVRLILLSIPFGIPSRDEYDRQISRLRKHLASNT